MFHPTLSTTDMRLLLPILVLSLPITAQNVGAPINPIPIDPTGFPCESTLVNLQVPAGSLFTCANGTLTKVQGGGGSGTGFNALSSGTNTTAAMVVGTGGSLNYTGMGSINATTLAGSSIGTSGATIPLLNANNTFGGTQTVNNITISGTCTGCGASGAFSNLTSATNTQAAMVVGNGASLNYTSLGTINASSLEGSVIGTSGAAIPLLNTSNSFGGTQTLNNLTVTGTCTGCGNSLGFNNLTSGTNTSAAMVIGTGGSLTV